MTSSGRIIALQSRAVVEVSGPDWRSFLQGLLTNDVEALEPGVARYCALLTPQGRVLFDLFVIGGVGGCLIDIAADRREAFVQRLTIYKLRAKVDIRPLDLGVFASPDMTAAAPGWIIDPRLPALGSRIYTEAGPTHDLELDYEAHRLALGVPGPADIGCDQRYPIEADFDLLNGIDFKKGCFVGQETTSRMKRRGAIRSRMLPIVFQGPPPKPGTEILAGSLRAGEVLSGMRGRAMALVRLDRAMDAELTADGRPVRLDPPAWFDA
jgi:folate-binding protein YgfZ